jgi:glycosyltransferase involved in cell wall biosynthesis
MHGHPDGKNVSMVANPPVKLPITAIVASRNEAEELRRCLPTLAFCAELIVIDLDSRDATSEVAKAHGARVFRRRPVPIAEWARADVAPHASHEWLLFADPDEELPAPLADALAALLPTVAADVGVVFAPLSFRFAGRPLRGTVWGGRNARRLLVRRRAVELTPTIWGGTRLRDGYRALELPFTSDTAIVHHWVSGYRDWLEKHRRYLRLEPLDRAQQGEITGVRQVLQTPFRSFHQSFVVRKGYLDGVRGLSLSVLWALFRTAAEIALLRELRSSRKGS